jgi:hypothetical protein
VALTSSWVRMNMISNNTVRAQRQTEPVQSSCSESLQFMQTRSEIADLSMDEQEQRVLPPMPVQLALSGDGANQLSGMSVESPLQLMAIQLAATSVAGKKAEITAANGLWLRSSPGGDKIRLLPMGTQFDVLGEDNAAALGYQWLRIKVEGVEGHVARSFVKIHQTAQKEDLSTKGSDAKKLTGHTEAKDAKDKKGKKKPAKLNQMTGDDALGILANLQAEKNYLYAPFVYAQGMKPKGTPWRGLTPGNWGGWCATAVSYLFKRLTGLSKSGNGKDWDGVMKNAIASGEIAYEKAEKPIYSALPSGSVCVWSGSKGTGGYGHVCIVIGGNWYADYWSGPLGQMQGAVPPAVVYVPTASAE